METMNPDPLVQFETWFEEAKVSELTLPEAVALATATHDGRPSVRMVLVKRYDRNGFVFFTIGKVARPMNWRQIPRCFGVSLEVVGASGSH